MWLMILTIIYGRKKHMDSLSDKKFLQQLADAIEHNVDEKGRVQVTEELSSKVVDRLRKIVDRISVERYKELISRLQWVDANSEIAGSSVCPVCGSTREEGHLESCEIVRCIEF
jgi:hypothetical protein